MLKIALALRVSAAPESVLPQFTPCEAEQKVRAHDDVNPGPAELTGLLKT